MAVERDFSVCKKAADGKHVAGPEETSTYGTLGSGVELQVDDTECALCSVPRQFWAGAELLDT